MNLKKALIAAGVVVALAAAGYAGFRGWQSARMSKMSMMPRTVAVQVAQAVRQDVPTIVTALGTVTANQTADVVSQVQGHLTNLYFKEGDFVRKGALLAKVDTRGYEANLQQYQGTLAEAQAQLANAKGVLERYERLYRQDSISRQDLEAQRAAVKQYEGSVRSALGQIANASVSVGYGRITAPISGYIGIRQRDLGNLVGPSDSTPIAVITQTTPIAVEFSIPQGNLSEVVGPVRSGQKLQVDVFDQSGLGLLARGTVSAVGNTIDQATGTVKVKSLFDNRDSKLFPNQFVNVKLVTGTLKNAVVVPTSAIQTSQNGLYVFTVGDDQVAHKAAVKIGPATEDGKTAILEGVAEGARVVTAGADSTSDGSKVTVVEPKAVDTSAVEKKSKGVGRGRR